MEGLRRLEGVNISKGRVRVEGVEQSHVAAENIGEQRRMLRMKFYITFWAFTNTQQAQLSGFGFFTKSQNTHIAGGSFTVVSLCCSCVHDFSTNSVQNNVNVLPVNTGGVQINIPVTQKPNSSPIFTGRQDVLDKLEKIFTHQVTSRPKSRCSCLLWGMGGIGKTQICLKFMEEMSHK